jgi:hypothetical protein
VGSLRNCSSTTTTYCIPHPTKPQSNFAMFDPPSSIPATLLTQLHQLWTDFPPLPYRMPPQVMRDAAKLEFLLVKRVYTTPLWCCSFCSPVVAVPSLAVHFFNCPARPTRCTCVSKFFAASKFITTITSDISIPQAATLVAIKITLLFFLNLEIAKLRLC